MSAKKSLCYIQTPFGFDIPAPKGSCSTELPKKLFNIKFVNSDLKIEVPEVGFISLEPTADDYIITSLNLWLLKQPKNYLAKVLINECVSKSGDRKILLYRFNQKGSISYSKKIYYDTIELTEEVLSVLSGNNVSRWKDKERVGFKLPYSFKAYFNK